MKKGQEIKDKTKDYLSKEIERIIEEIEKKKLAAKRTMRLFAVLEDERDVEEIKVQLREIRDEENALIQEKERIEKEINTKGNLDGSGLKQAISFYLAREKNLNEEDKKVLIRMAIKEVIVQGEEITVFLY